jgi:hypothetical protein
LPVSVFCHRDKKRLTHTVTVRDWGFFK